MYLEDAQDHDHRRALVAAEDDRRKGTGQVDLSRDDWLEDDAPRFVLVNLHGDILRGGATYTKSDAEREARAEWANGWEVYVTTAPKSDAISS